MSRIVSFDHHPDFAGWDEAKNDNEADFEAMPKRRNVALLLFCVAGAWLVFLSPFLFLG